MVVEVGEASTIDRTLVENVSPEMLSSVEPASADSELLFPEPRPLFVRILMPLTKRLR